MKEFFVKISFDMPYPMDFEFREKGSSAGTAINRALRKLRKEKRIAGRKIKEFRIKSIQL